MEGLNKYVKKSHLKMVERFNSDLEAFRQETGEDVATLYEDATTSFTLADVRVSNGNMVFEYDGKEESHAVVLEDFDTGEYYEDDIDGIVEWVRFWRSCLRRAKRYWAMDAEKLDKIQDGLIEDTEDNEQ